MSELEDRLTHPANLAHIIHTKNVLEAGRRKDVPNLTIEEKVAVVLSSEEIGVTAAAEAFDLSKQQVSNLRTGKSGGEELQKVVEAKKGRIKDLALEKLLNALNELTTERMTNIRSARDAAAVAKDIATVIGKMDGENINFNGAKVLIYAPDVKREEDYPVVEISAEEIA